FEHDADGRIIARTSAPEGRTEYARDSLAHLASVQFVQEPGAPRLTYRFNRAGEMDSAGGPFTAQHGDFSAGRLTRLSRPPAGVEACLYDLHGNTIATIQSLGADTLARREFRYGPAGELLAIVGTTPEGSDSAAYTYDPWLYRSRKTAAGATRYFIRDE